MVIIVGYEVDGFFFNVHQHFLGNFRQSRLGVTHGGGGVIINAAEVTLAINQGITHGKVLRHADHGVIDR